MKKVILLLFFVLTLVSGIGYKIISDKIDNGYLRVAEGQRQIAEGEQKLNAGKKKLAAGEKMLAVSKKGEQGIGALAVAGAIAVLPVTSGVLLMGHKKIQEGDQQVTVGKQKVKAGEQQLSEGKAALAKGLLLLSFAEKIKWLLGFLTGLFGLLTLVLLYRWRSEWLKLFKRG